MYEKNLISHPENISKAELLFSFVLFQKRHALSHSVFTQTLQTLQFDAVVMMV